ncbi:hypothetical protein TNCV_2965591 [Trichonephila clavipes]|nr:hypothetical protein TNCV_2965591 [Trichonephila clavipes]
MLKLLRFDTFELQETKLPARLINTTNDRRLVQGHETTPLRAKGDIKHVSRELDEGVKGCTSWMKGPEFFCSRVFAAWGTLNSRRTTSPLVRLVEGKERWEAPDHLQGVLLRNWDETELNRSVT